MSEIIINKNWFQTLRDSSKSFQEDYPHENGNYVNTCFKCKSDFMGHKRRIACKDCYNPIKGVNDGWGVS